MLKLKAFLLVTIGIGFGVVSTVADAAPIAPPIGEVVPTRDRQFKGWAVGPWATWCQPFSLKCGYVLFRSGSRIVVALTTPVELDARGGEKSVKIIREFTIDTRAGEEIANGGAVGERIAVVCLVDQHLRHARLFATDGRSLIKREMSYKAEAPCDFGDD